MVRGRCELCGILADLHDSHYLPKGGYKRMRATDLRNPNPVVLAGGKAKQSSSQVRDYKFCTECEKRFNDGGERWILRHIPQNYGDPFWLHVLLNSKKPILNGDDRLFPQATIPEVDMGKLIYFALSIFWRGTRRWKAVDGSPPERLYLGSKERSIRNYLLGGTTLPRDVAVTVAVWPYEEVMPAALMPRADSYQRYWFYYYGFIFLLALGKKIPALQRRTSSNLSPEKFLTVSPQLGRLIHQSTRRKLLSLDRSKLEGMFKEIKALRSTGHP